MQTAQITLAKKVTLKLSLYLALIFAATLALTILLLYTKLQDNLIRQAQAITKYHVEALAKPLWDLDNKQIDKIVDNIAREDFVVKVLLKDEVGQTLKEAGSVAPSIKRNAGDNDQEYIDTESLEYFSKRISYNYKGQNKYIGNLEVYVDKRQVNDFLEKFMIKSFGLCGIFLGVLVLLIDGTINRAIEPVKRLSRQLSKVDVELNEPIERLDSDVIEVNELQNALLKMKKHYENYQDDLAQTVTDRTKQLQDYKNNLEALVEEQMKDIIIAKVAAENANHAKTEFLTNMSHELRTPMHAIISYSQMGMEKVDSAEKDKLEKYFDNINKSGRRLLVLLNDLLDLSKLEAGRMILRMEPHNIRNCIDEVIIELEELLRSKSLLIDQKIETNMLTAEFDKVRTMQVMMNLLSNAIKFTDPGKIITIRYRDKKVMTAKGVFEGIEVSVEDKGIGIPPNELESVFDKFVQSSITNSGSGGTGLGLAICREIVNAHKGIIWAENIEGGGARFSFVLPYGNAKNITMENSAQISMDIEPQQVAEKKPKKKAPKRSKKEKLEIRESDISKSDEEKAGIKPKENPVRKSNVTEITARLVRNRTKIV